MARQTLTPFLIVLFFSIQSWGSYRVYQLKVTHLDPSGKPKKTEVVLSILDHLQYENYHGSFGRARVEYLESWYCPGDTSYKNFCKQPKTPERAIASEREKRIPVK